MIVSEGVGNPIFLKPLKNKHFQRGGGNYSNTNNLTPPLSLEGKFLDFLELRKTDVLIIIIFYTPTLIKKINFSFQKGWGWEIICIRTIYPPPPKIF